ncbi:hypothetical protein TEA_020630 [Camellia sinensis var. sinensis]|uniref:Uncharacterized protein n=1 Tax=Camellia sinensis var. sinensis TaxID=542762 RepID=A0A4S4D3S0_CAMSN|nr:hypothetical protein TEA_020630 [Camellia sinensis var. sinensis]
MKEQKKINSYGKTTNMLIGKNPIWVYNTSMDEIRVFRRLEGGEMEGGDMFCVSAKQPLWFTLKRFQNESDLKSEFGNENELLQSSCGLTSVDDLEIDSIDVSDIDPVKEFGFLVMGHEFDRYPKQMIRHAKTWEWFLEQPNEDSEDEVSDSKGNKGVRRKRKKSEGNDDDEWRGEREDDKELITKRNQSSHGSNAACNSTNITGTNVKTPAPSSNNAVFLLLCTGHNRRKYIHQLRIFTLTNLFRKILTYESGNFYLILAEIYLFSNKIVFVNFFTLRWFQRKTFSNKCISEKMFSYVWLCPGGGGRGVAEVEGGGGVSGLVVVVQWHWLGITPKNGKQFLSK